MLKYSTIRPYLPLLIVVLMMAAVYVATYYHAFSWNGIDHFNQDLIDFQKHHPSLTPLLFILIYILFALLSFPGIFLLSLLGGYLFPQPWSTLYVVFAATVGAALLFLAVRSAFGGLFRRRAGRELSKMEQGFHENAVNYLLFLRLIPLFPYTIVNIAGAYFNVSFKSFIWTTFIGMIPSVFVYTQAGRGLLEIMQIKEPLTAAHFLNSHLILGLVGLALLSLLPIFFKRYRATRFY